MTENRDLLFKDKDSICLFLVLNVNLLRGKVLDYEQNSAGIWLDL